MSLPFRSSDDWRERPPRADLFAPIDLWRGDEVSEARAGGWVHTRDAWPPEPLLSAPTTFDTARTATSLWIAGAESIVTSLPREPMWRRDPEAGDGHHVLLRFEGNCVYAMEMVLADQEPVELGLSLTLARMVWIVGDWSLYVPSALLHDSWDPRMGSVATLAR